MTEPNYVLAMNLLSNTGNLDSDRYEINTESDASGPLAAVEWVAANANVFAVTPRAALNSDLRAELTEGGALLPVTLAITVNAPPSGVPVVFNFQGTAFNEVAVYNNALSLLSTGRRQLSGDHKRRTAIHRCAGVGDCQCRPDG